MLNDSKIAAYTAILREELLLATGCTGREVSKEKEEKIISTILNDNVPKNLDKFLDK